MRGGTRKVSVIVPTRDRPEFLAEALESIRRVEGPDLECEILVCDNGGSETTRAVAERFDARYFKVEKQGAAAARNAGLRAASGEYIAHLDDDDLWMPDHLRPHLDLLESRQDLLAVVGQIQCTDHERIPFGDPWPEEAPADGDLFMKFMSYFPQVGGTVSRASVRDTVGLFDETLLGDADWDWQLRIAKAHKIGFVPVPCVLFRQRPPGSADAVHLKRIPHTRRIFFRHALPEWRRWKSPHALVHTYNLTLSSYYSYFAMAVLERERAGDSTGALAAVRHAVALNPVRFAIDLAKTPDLRSSLVAALKRRLPFS